MKKPHKGSPLNILCVITARGGSKGIPDKNIKELGGKPLISYSIEQAQKSVLITRSIISTDDERIADVARQHGGEVPFMRPKELAQDATPHLPVMQHAVSFLESLDGTVYDHVVIFQPTSPFRRVRDIDGAIQKLVDTKADSAISVCEVDPNRHPAKMRKFDGDILVPIAPELAVPEGTRRQEFSKIYRRNSAVFAMRRDTYMKKNSLYGDTTAGYIMPRELSIDIDEPRDWAEAEYMLAQLREQGYEF